MPNTHLGDRDISRAELAWLSCDQHAQQGAE